MAKQLLNDAERFLLERWAESRSLEESMESVRTKYRELFDRIVEKVTDKHPELDCNTVRVTQFYSEGSIGFGRRTWARNGEHWFPGLWIEGLRLENLSADDTPDPIASIWIPTKAAKVANLNLSHARSAVITVAQERLTPDEFRQCGKSDSDEQSILTFQMPPKHELLSMFADGDGHGFIDVFDRKFDLLAVFVSTLDKLLAGIT